jgi:hypothetical protein
MPGIARKEVGRNGIIYAIGGSKELFSLRHIL